MKYISRRQVLHALALGAAVPSITWAQVVKNKLEDKRGRNPVLPEAPKRVPRLGDRIRIVIPSDPGGGWDQTGRGLGDALLAAGAIDAVDYENRGGKGGTVGLTHYADKYLNDPNTLLIGGSVMLGAIALHNPVATLAKLHPIARLTSEPILIAALPSSEFKSALTLMDRIKSAPGSLKIAGGSAGGIDHVFAGMLYRAAGVDPKLLSYVPSSSGRIPALTKGLANIALGGYGEFDDAMRDGSIRILGVSTERDQYGAPSLLKHGLKGALANWRGVFTGRQVSEDRLATVRNALAAVVTTPAWRATLAANRWQSALMVGGNLQLTVDLDQAVMRAMVSMMGLKA